MTSKEQACIVTSDLFVCFFFSLFKSLKKNDHLFHMLKSQFQAFSNLKKVSKGWCSFHLVMSTVNVNVHQCFLHVALTLTLVCFLWKRTVSFLLYCCIVMNWCVVTFYTFLFFTVFCCCMYLSRFNPNSFLLDGDESALAGCSACFSLLPFNYFFLSTAQPHFYCSPPFTST